MKYGLDFGDDISIMSYAFDIQLIEDGNRVNVEIGIPMPSWSVQIDNTASSSIVGSVIIKL